MSPPNPDSTVHKEALFDRRWTSVVALCVTLGLASVEVGDTASRQRYSHFPAALFFWLGLILIFGSIAVRVLTPGAGRQERLTLIVLLGGALYLVKILTNLDTPFNDEWIHLRNTQDILRTHHLFAFNPLLPTATYYPGLAAAAAEPRKPVWPQPLCFGPLYYRGCTPSHLFLRLSGRGKGYRILAFGGRCKPDLCGQPNVPVL